MRIGKVFNIQVTVNPFFLVFLLFWALTGMIGETVALFVIVFLHEMAHAAVAKGYGVTVNEIELFPFGGIARLEGLVELDPAIEKHIAWAGPLLNIVLAGLALIVYNNRLFFGPLAETAVLFFIRSNLVLAFFNLLPVLPLDGGRILRATLSSYLSFRKATEVASQLSKGLSIAFFFGGIILFFYGYLNISVVVIALFLFFAAGREESMAIYVFLRFLAQKERELERRGALRGEQVIAHEDATLKEIMLTFQPKKYHLVLVINPLRQVIGEVSETAIIEAALTKGFELPVKKILEGPK